MRFSCSDRRSCKGHRDDVGRAGLADRSGGGVTEAAVAAPVRISLSVPMMASSVVSLVDLHRESGGAAMLTSDASLGRSWGLLRSSVGRQQLA